jgi:hypothetical protein
VSIAMVTPRLLDLGETRMKSSIRKLQGTSRYLFNESVFRKRAFILYIDIKEGEYWVETPQVQGEFVENVQVADSFVAKRARLPQNVRIVSVQSPRLGRRTEGQASIQFFPFGFVEPATIHLEDHNKNRFTLYFQPITGTVKIYPGHVEITRQG